MQCTITEKEIEKCCCEERGDKLYCKLSGKELDECCCK